jgi:hypothetical protein
VREDFPRSIFRPFCLPNGRAVGAYGEVESMPAIGSRNRRPEIRSPEGDQRYTAGPVGMGSRNKTGYDSVVLCASALFHIHLLKFGE